MNSGISARYPTVSCKQRVSTIARVRRTTKESSVRDATGFKSNSYSIHVQVGDDDDGDDDDDDDDDDYDDDEEEEEEEEDQ